MELQTIELTGSAVAGLGSTSQKLRSASLPTRVCLGRVKPKAQPSCLMLGSYLDADQVAGAVPLTYTWGEKAAASIARPYGNTRYGCCVWSGKVHQMGFWTANDSDSGGEVIATEEEVIQQYFAYTGGRDVGSSISEVLNIWRSRGIVANGKNYKIDGYVSVDWRKKELCKAAIYVLGGLCIGFDLPSSWQNTAVWDVTNSGIVGGHDVHIFGWDEQGVLLASWGRVYKMTWAAVVSTRWISEMYAMLGPQWYGSDRVAPLGMRAEKLVEDLAKIGNGVIPDTEPAPPPIPTPGFPYQISLGSDLPAGPCEIKSGNVTIQANVSTTRPAGTYLLTKADPLPPG